MNKLPDLAALEAACDLIYPHLQQTPHISWPMLNTRAGFELWLKHENHNPTGSFKVRGGLVYLHNLLQREPNVPGVVAATRGNFGQSIAYAAAQHGLRSVVCAPEGNSPDKNRAMQTLGAELIVHGADFDESVAHAIRLAESEGLHLIPSFHMDLVAGVATYAFELLQSVSPDKIYVPIGLGSGICGVAAAKQALGKKTEIIGVVAEGADTYSQSYRARRLIPTNAAHTIADGLAVRNPSGPALEVMLSHVANVITVTDIQIEQAMRMLFEDTHNVVEGAGAAATAGAFAEADQNKGQTVAAVVTGSNVHRQEYTRILQAT